MDCAGSSLHGIFQARILEWVAISLSRRSFPTQGLNPGVPWWLRWQRVCLQCRRPGFDPWVKKIPWSRAWLPLPIFLTGKSHRQRSLVGYSPWGYKELDMNDGLTLSPRLGNTHQYPKIYSYFYLWKEKLKSEKE